MLLGRVLALFAAAWVPATGRADQASTLGQGVDNFRAHVPWSPPSACGAITHDSPPAPGWTGYRGAVALNLGLGSAIGEMGVTVALWPLPFLGTEFGLGRGFTGTQYSLMEKLALGSSSSARFVAGAGVAYADGSSMAPGGSVWLNVDLVGFELRPISHFAFLLAGGLTYGLAGGPLQTSPAGDCSTPGCELDSKVPGHVAVQARTGLGVWF